MKLKLNYSFLDTLYKTISIGVGRDLSPCLPWSIQSRRNEDIRLGMRFPSGIAAGPVPAEPSAAPSGRRRFLTILQIDSNVFKPIPRIRVCVYMCMSVRACDALHCHRAIIAPLACAATIDLVVSVSRIKSTTRPSSLSLSFNRRSERKREGEREILRGYSRRAVLGNE